MILVTGGAGVMGSRLVRGLCARGHQVRVLTLPNDPGVARLADLRCQVAYGDIAEAGALKGVFDGVRTVYHLAAVIIAYDPAVLRRVNVEGTRNVVTGASGAGVGHFVYISSASAAEPLGSDYARSKLEAEEAVKGQDRMAWTIVRPTLIYGRDEGQEFMMFLEYLKKYPIVPFIGSGRARKSPVLADDVVSGLLAIAGNPRTHGRTYDFGGGEEISMRDLARLMLRHQGLSKPIVGVPVPLCRLAAAVLERTMRRPPLTRYAISRILHNAAPDSSPARRDLGYQPRGVREGMQLCYPLHGKQHANRQ